MLLHGVALVSYLQVCHAGGLVDLYCPAITSHCGHITVVLCNAVRYLTWQMFALQALSLCNSLPAHQNTAPHKLEW